MWVPHICTSQTVMDIWLKRLVRGQILVAQVWGGAEALFQQTPVLGYLGTMQ